MVLSFYIYIYIVKWAPNHSVEPVTTRSESEHYPLGHPEVFCNLKSISKNKCLKQNKMRNNEADINIQKMN